MLVGSGTSASLQAAQTCIVDSNACIAVASQLVDCQKQFKHCSSTAHFVGIPVPEHTW